MKVRRWMFTGRKIHANDNYIKRRYCRQSNFLIIQMSLRVTGWNTMLGFIFGFMDDFEKLFYDFWMQYFSGMTG